MKIELKQHGYPTMRYDIPNSARNLVLGLLGIIENEVEKTQTQNGNTKT